jgi:tellurite resistance protein
MRMRIFMSMIALILGVTIASSAQAGLGRWGEDLRFVAETSIPKTDSSGTASLCHLVDFADILFVPIYTSVQGYALSNDGCTGNSFRDVTPEDFNALQLSSLVPTTLPVIASANITSLIWGHAWFVVVALGLLFRAVHAVLGHMRRPRKSGAPDMLAIHSLVAMSQVAIADGRLDDAEVHQIAKILTRLTGKIYAPQQVMEMLRKLNPSPSDIEQVGQDLSDKDRQIVLEAALNIAVADGEIHPNEYAVVSGLAQRMRIGADPFRSALARISTHLQTVQAT